MLTTQLYANNAVSTLASPVAPGDTSIQLTTITNFSVPSANQFALATMDSGSGVEIISYTGITAGQGTAGTLTGVSRAQENTTAQSFTAGTRIEMRATAHTFAQFVRYTDRLYDIASVDALSPPAASNGNSYICASLDDQGNPIVAYDKGAATWRFTNYPLTILANAAQAGSTTSFCAFSGASTTITGVQTGVYVIQFTSGVNQGYARAVTSVNSTGIFWSTPLPNAPATLDTFEVYQSISSALSSATQNASMGLIYAIVLGD
jgi:hypothetical protein